MNKSNKKNIDPSERQIERLAIVRYQISVCQEQINQPSPLYNLTLNTMQDFVESALHIIAESHKINVASPSFDVLLEKVLSKLEDEELSGYIVLMKAMNKARVSFKHHGNSTDKREVNSHLTESTEFVRELSKRAYDKDLDNISITSFIKNEKVRQYLESAEKKHLASDAKAMIDLRIAFDELVRDYTNRKLATPGTSIFDMKPSFLPTGREMEYLGIEKIIKWIDNIDDWLKYMSLGINMRRYAYFNVHTPYVSYSLDRTPFTDLLSVIEYDADRYERCRRFVIDTALAFAQDDFDFDAWSSRRFN